MRKNYPNEKDQENIPEYLLDHDHFSVDTSTLKTFLEIKEEIDKQDKKVKKYYYDAHDIFVRPDMFDIMEYGKNKGVEQYINCNGIILTNESFIFRLKRCGIGNMLNRGDIKKFLKTIKTINSHSYYIIDLFFYNILVKEIDFIETILENNLLHKFELNYIVDQLNYIEWNDQTKKIILSKDIYTHIKKKLIDKISAIEWNDQTKKIILSKNIDLNIRKLLVNRVQKNYSYLWPKTISPDQTDLDYKKDIISFIRKDINSVDFEWFLEKIDCFPYGEIRKKIFPVMLYKNVKSNILYEFRGIKTKLPKKGKTLLLYIRYGLFHESWNLIFRRILEETLKEKFFENIGIVFREPWNFDIDLIANRTTSKNLYVLFSEGDNFLELINNPNIHFVHFSDGTPQEYKKGGISIINEYIENRFDLNKSKEKFPYIALSWNAEFEKPNNDVSYYVHEYNNAIKKLIDKLKSL